MQLFINSMHFFNINLGVHTQSAKFKFRHSYQTVFASAIDWLLICYERNFSIKVVEKIYFIIINMTKSLLIDLDMNRLTQTIHDESFHLQKWLRLTYI